MRPQGLCLSELAERSRALGVSGTQDLQIFRAQKQAPQADLGGLASIPIRDNSTGDWKSVSTGLPLLNNIHTSSLLETLSLQPGTE